MSHIWPLTKAFPLVAIGHGGCMLTDWPFNCDDVAGLQARFGGRRSGLALVDQAPPAAFSPSPSAISWLTVES